MKNIIIVGFMGTGKNAVGRTLAKRLGLKYVDLDNMIEKDQSMKINDIFDQKGESYFREIEKKVVRLASQKSDQVIAAGGGAVLFEENMENFRKNGIIICLTARPEVILERTKHTSHRPLLNVEDPMGKIKELLEKRAPFYAKADFSIDTSDMSVEEIANEIIEIIKNDR